jgi:hypothetical protein
VDQRTLCSADEEAYLVEKWKAWYRLLQRPGREKWYYEKLSGVSTRKERLLTAGGIAALKELQR